MSVQANSGISDGGSHKGLVEELVEKAKELLPHQLTGSETQSSTAYAANTHRVRTVSLFYPAIGVNMLAQANALLCNVCEWELSCAMQAYLQISCSEISDTSSEPSYGLLCGCHLITRTTCYGCMLCVVVSLHN